MNAIVDWIKNRKGESIPDIVLEDFNKFVETDYAYFNVPIINWIMYRKGELIPEYMWNEKDFYFSDKFDCTHLWIMFRLGESIPTCLELSINENDRQSYFKYWIKCRRNEDIPKSLMTYHGIYHIMLWIKYRKNEPIPEFFKYNKWQYDEYRDEPMQVYWIKYRPGESIPYELLYDNWYIKREYSKYEILDLWIQYRIGEPIPECITLEYSDKLLKNWVKYRNGEPFQIDVFN
jgi:hypothetical protein